MDKYSVGIDIGGTKCAVILGKGEIPEKQSEDFILEKRVFKTADYTSPDETIQRFIDEIEDILRIRHIACSQLVGIGISCGGPLDHVTGVIMSPPNLIGWDDVHIVDRLKAQFECPVYIENDANACALAEYYFGAGKGFHSMVFLTFGTGLGAGLILEDRLYHGANDMAGEIGHIGITDFGPVGYGKAGSFEGYCSGGGIRQIAETRLKEEMQSGRKVAECWYTPENLNAGTLAMAARDGDPFAKSVYEISAASLGKGLSTVIDILNPEAIVIGSVFARSSDLFIETMTRELRKYTLKRSLDVCRIVPAGLGDAVGDYAALAAAFGA